MDVDNAKNVSDKKLDPGTDLPVLDNSIGFVLDSSRDRHLPQPEGTPLLPYFSSRTEENKSGQLLG